MGAKKALPIGNDDFRKIREGNFYYIDKTLMIKDFIETKDEVTLITRPRRFGKTLNMTMMREFFDITKDSKAIFDGLSIMSSEYASQMNSRPVIYFTFKDAKGSSIEILSYQLKQVMRNEYGRYEQLFQGKIEESVVTRSFYQTYESLMDHSAPYFYLSGAITHLVQVVFEFFHVPPVLLIDEYDQPIISSYQHGYHEQMGDFFSSFYGSGMKGNPALHRALLTGVQRVAKESIFSQFNNVRVYTVLDRKYAPYFGLTESETKEILEDYGLVLDEAVQKKYNGYRFGDIEMYNPWSILNYADIGILDNYWINTSSNFLVREALQQANKPFLDKFAQLISGMEIPVSLTLATAYVERGSNYSLWGLFVNAGYLTAIERIDENTQVVRIPNDEVISEFQVLIAEISGIEELDLRLMFHHLLKKKMEAFFEIYQNIVLSCTSYLDAKENAYHMLFLGMCVSLRGAYKVTSNLETGYGRSDITLESLTPSHSHVIIEFKQGADLAHLKEEALKQITTQKYYAGLKGEVICIGLAHDKKRCEMAYQAISV